MLALTTNSIRPLAGDFDALVALLSAEEAQVITDDIVIEPGSRHTFVYHREDQAADPLVLIGTEAFETLAWLGGASVDRALERIHRVARGFESPPLSMPPQWHKYQQDRKIAFFALPRSMNAGALRWIAESLPSGDTCFWKMTSAGDEQKLQSFSGDSALADDARQEWVASLETALARLPIVHTGPRTLQAAVDLDAVGGAAISRMRAYSSWLPLLTPQQEAAVRHDRSEGLKVRGPAGSGKTVILQLKALHDLYTAVDDGLPLPRILYLTHSWALAEMVDNSLLAMDERGIARTSIDVMPLTWLREVLYGEPPEGIEVLGDDSLEGKRQQLALISESIDAIKSSDWPTYSADVGSDLRVGVESPAESIERTVLSWNLMREFAEVIDSNQLKPGLNSLKRYLELPREPWMVGLPSAADREFAFAVYRTFVGRLVEEGQLTTDQALDDFRKYLESYTWNIRRETDGYDFILVDEFHLFNDTERYLIHLLTRDIDAPLSAMIAMDPQQSPFALLTGLPEGSLSREATEKLGSMSPSASLDLDVIHRFTRAIHSFVNLIYARFPNLIELGDDWQYDFAETTTSRGDGELPVVFEVGSNSEAIRTAIDLAKSLSTSVATPEDRIAIVCLGVEELEGLRSSLQELLGDATPGFTVMESRDDVDRLNYSRRSITVGTAEFCAGLQFSHVVVLGTSAGTSGRVGGASAERVALSALYLAATRAERYLAVVSAGSSGQLHQLVQHAVEQGIATPATIE